MLIKMSFDDAIIKKEMITHMNDEDVKQNLLQTYNLYDEHNYHMKDIVKVEFNLYGNDMCMTETLKTEFNLHDEDIDVKEELKQEIKQESDLCDEIVSIEDVIPSEVNFCDEVNDVIEEVIQTDDDFHEANVQANLINMTKSVQDEYAKMCDSKKQAERSRATNICRMRNRDIAYEVCIVNGKVVIKPKKLQPRDAAKEAMKEQPNNVEAEHRGKLFPRKPEDASVANQATTLETVYGDHIVNEEMVIGPAVIQHQDNVYKADQTEAVTAYSLSDLSRGKSSAVPRVVTRSNHQAPVEPPLAAKINNSDHEERVLYICDQCHTLLPTKKSAALHSKSCLIIFNLYACDMCSKTFESDQHMNDHKKVSHNLDFLWCSKCHQYYKSNYSLIAHKCNHARLHEKPSKCVLCALKFGQWNLLSKRMVDSGCCPMPSIDWNQYWESHVDSLCDQLSVAIIAMRKLLSSFTPDKLRAAYFANFHSLISHAVFIWGNSPNANKILTLQEQAICLVAEIGVTPDDHKQIFRALRIMTHYSQYLFDLLLFARTIAYKLVYLKGEFITGCSNFYFINNRVGLSDNNPRVIGPTCYKHLPFDLQNEASDDLFRLQLENILLENPLYSVSEFMELEF